MYGEGLEGDETVLADVGMRLCLSDLGASWRFHWLSEAGERRAGVEGV